MERTWLGEWPEESGLAADVVGGKLRSFGLSKGHKTVKVDLGRRCVLTEERYEEDGDELWEDWLARWRDDLRSETQPKEYSPSCSFCGKTQAEVLKLIMGPSTGICNECVELCQEILGDELASKSET